MSRLKPCFLKIPARCPISAIEVAKLPRWPTVSFSASSAWTVPGNSAAQASMASVRRFIVDSCYDDVCPRRILRKRPFGRSRSPDGLIQLQAEFPNDRSGIICRLLDHVMEFLWGGRDGDRSRLLDQQSIFRRVDDLAYPLIEEIDDRLRSARSRAYAKPGISYQRNTILL